MANVSANINSSAVTDGGDDPYSCYGILACHGYCMDIMECTYSDILTEGALIKTIFDWQNAVYLAVIFGCIYLGKFLFKRQYEFKIALSHNGIGIGKALSFALGADVQGKALEKQSPGFGGEGSQTPPLGEEGVPGVGLQKTESRHAKTAEERDSHYNLPKRFSSQHNLAPEDMESATVLSADGEAVNGIKIKIQGQTLWSRSLSSPAMLVALSAFLFAITSICASAIAEVTPQGERGYVGFDTQFGSDAEPDGFSKRWESIGTSIVWMLIGIVLMLISQVINNRVTFHQIDLVGEITTQTQESKHKGHGHGNIAASIIEGGSVVAAGMVAAGNVGGAPGDWGEDLLSVIIYFAASQLMFVLYTKVFDCFFIEGTISDAVKQVLPELHHITLPSDPDPLTRGNIAVAISYASMMVSYAMLISNAVYKSYELSGFVVWSVGGGALLLVFRVVLDRFIACRVNLDDAMHHHFNWGFAAVVGAMQVRHL